MNLEVKQVPIVESPELDLALNFSYIMFRQMCGYDDKGHFIDYLKELLITSHSKMFVAYSPVQQVGFAFYCDISDDARDEVYVPALEYASTGITFAERSKTVGMIGVSSHHWRRNIGSSLLDAILTDAREDNIPQLYASCINGTNGPSCNLFKKKGFRELAVCDKFYFSGYSASFMMREL
jgi:GNAT superfamily N-acetyltransferase